MDVCMSGHDQGSERQKLARMARRLNAAAPPCRVSGLVLMTDDRVEADWRASAADLPAGSAVIVRHRDAPARERLALALVACCRPRGIRVLVADDIKLAIRSGADGVHLPERRMDLCPGARRMRGDWILSTSVHDRASLARAHRFPFDLALASPFMPTRSHPGARTLGVVRLAALVAGSRIPVVALGGIDASNAPLLAGVNVRGIALIRGWVEGS